jgi:hypothetical protein
MNTHDQILAFVKLNRRIPSADTQYDALITGHMNSTYEVYCRKLQQLGEPNMRVVGTPLAIVGGTQNYNLPANFDRMIDESVQYQYSATAYGKVILPLVWGPDAEIWETATTTVYAPQACRIVASTAVTFTPLQLRLLPNFTETGGTVAFSYWKKPAALAAGGTLELPQLADAVAWNCISNSYDYFRDTDGTTSQARADARARESYKEALGLITS